MRRLAALVFASLLGACASSADNAAAPTPPYAAWIVAADGRAIGQANFTEGPAGVLIRLEFTQPLAPGWHGLHLHQRGDCRDFAAGFQAAGGHIGTGAGVQHGLMNTAGPEAGDLPNLFAPPAGLYGAQIFTPRITLRADAPDGRAPLLDADGSALIVHAGPDDQLSQPIGGAGPRIACAALTQLP